MSDVNAPKKDAVPLVLWSGTMPTGGRGPLEFDAEIVRWNDSGRVELYHIDGYERRLVSPNEVLGEAWMLLFAMTAVKAERGPMRPAAADMIVNAAMRWYASTGVEASEKALFALSAACEAASVQEVL